MANGDPVPGSLYIYAPNKAAPIIFVVAYGVSAIGHIWQCYRYKSWKLLGMHPLCAVLFTAGYAVREYGAYNYIYTSKNVLIAYILSQVFIYVCPPLLELANYHILGRILYYVPYFAPLPPSRVLSTFGGLLALVELLNSLGVALASNPASAPSQQHLGSSLTLAAIGIQLGVIVIFIGIAGIFHYRCIKAEVHAKAVSTPLITLYVSMVFIAIRSIYRLVEHVGNTNVDLDDPESLKTLSPLLRYEWFFYVFESTLMFLNSALWNIWNPGRYLPRNYHVHLSQDGMTEVEGEEDADDRPFLAKAAHIFTFGLLFRRKRSYQSTSELNNFSMADHQGSAESCHRP
ncbi:putative RTA1 domain protein [Xylaria bambusicola]|uniref:putative RTA1 domain protein n=1 Tax=Xylaria bambusicola TaxID=326684 RepID=UPI002008238D|nr:putative RTA1 domain protein [Xylaria bambusicola]KAI0517893.1 putative RTA1 domain protein [Xylaria bambusicola]